MNERYFITLFGSQHNFGAIHRPKLSHTYAAFTEEVGDTEVRRELTISWLPRDGTINPLGGPEPGRNYSFAETTAWLDTNGSTNRWASKKTQIQQQLFQSAAERVAELDRGTLRYVMIDRMSTRPHHASNCIHAVSDLAIAIADLGMLSTGLLNGNDASRAVYQYFWRYLIDPELLSAEGEQRSEEMQRAEMTASNEIEKGR